MSNLPLEHFITKNAILWVQTKVLDTHLRCFYFQTWQKAPGADFVEQREAEVKAQTFKIFLELQKQLTSLDILERVVMAASVQDWD